MLLQWASGSGRGDYRAGMNGEQVKTWAPLASPLLAAAALVWAVASWRRAGSVIRIHALLYREVLVLRVFNAGRTTDQIEHIVLGGWRRGIDGLELTPALEQAIKLAPGESWKHELEWRSVVPDDRQRMVAGGWESVWLLMGSMRQRRVEVTVIGEDRPAVVGWRLSSRGVGLSRYLPLVAATLMLLVVGAASGHGSWGALALAALVGLVIVRILTAGPFESVRRRFERWTIAAIAAVATIAWIVRADATNSDWVNWVITPSLLAGLVLAWPGAIAGFVRVLQQRTNAWKTRSATSRR